MKKSKELKEKIKEYRGVKKNTFHIVRACASRFDRADTRLASVENLPPPESDTIHPDKANALREYKNANRIGEQSWRHLWDIVKMQDALIDDLLEAWKD